jgi:hypothetical protein
MTSETHIIIIIMITTYFKCCLSQVGGHFALIKGLIISTGIIEK